MAKFEACYVTSSLWCPFSPTNCQKDIFITSIFSNDNKVLLKSAPDCSNYTCLFSLWVLMYPLSSMATHISFFLFAPAALSFVIFSHNFLTLAKLLSTNFLTFCLYRNLRTSGRNCILQQSIAKSHILTVSRSRCESFATVSMHHCVD